MTTPSKPPAPGAGTLLKAPVGSLKPKSAQNLDPKSTSILIVGDSGTFKTGFARTLPKPFVFDFDDGMAVNKGQPIDYMTFKDTARGMTPRAGLYKWGEGWDEFIKVLNEIGELIDKGQCPYETLYFDSVTFMADLAMNHVLKTANDINPHQGSYGAQQQYLMRIMNQLSAWPILKVFTAHIHRDTNDLTKTVEKLPLVTGKLAGRMSTYFDEVYFTSAEQKPGSAYPTFQFLTQSDPTMKQAKSRAGVPNKIGMDYALIKPYLEGTAKKSS